MNLPAFSVFAAKNTPSGGKHFAVSTLEHNMQAVAAQQPYPLTAFMEGNTARFFSAKGEKGASDSGALVVAHVLHPNPLEGQQCRVHMGDEHLDAVWQQGVWYSAQGSTEVMEPKVEVSSLTEALNIDPEAIWGGIFAAGAGSKRNLIIEVESHTMLDSIAPHMEALAAIQKEYGANGIVVFCLDGVRGDVDLRWFSPAKNMPEDNAGSFTVSSLAAFLVMRLDLEGNHTLKASQGWAMGKPSELFVRFTAQDYGAHNIMVGGVVQSL